MSWNRVVEGLTPIKVPDTVARSAARLKDELRDLDLLLWELLPASEDGSRWCRGRRDGSEDYTAPIYRSPSAASTVEEVRRSYEGWLEDVAWLLEQYKNDDECVAIVRIYVDQLLAEHGYKIAPHPRWGGIDIFKTNEPPPRPVFPDWMVREETNRLRKRVEYRFGRVLTEAELRVARDWAIEALERKQNQLGKTLNVGTAINEKGERKKVQYGLGAALHGVGCPPLVLGATLREKESAERAERRRVARMVRRSEGPCDAPTRPDRAPNGADALLAILRTNPTANAEQLARRLGRRKRDVLRDLEALSKAGRIAVKKVGRYIRRDPVPEAVPPYGCEGCGDAPERSRHPCRG